MALGASASDVQARIMLQTLGLTGLGMLIGVAASWLLGRALTGLLFGVTATDPMTFAGMTLLLGAVAALAGYVPARRAARIDPDHRAARAVARRSRRRSLVRLMVGPRSVVMLRRRRGGGAVRPSANGREQHRRFVRRPVVPRTGEPSRPAAHAPAPPEGMKNMTCGNQGPPASSLT